LGKPVLLHVRFSFPCVYHPCDIVLSNFNCDGIFPVMWRGKLLFFSAYLSYIVCRHKYTAFSFFLQRL
jgi:hypothetical protein